MKRLLNESKYYNINLRAVSKNKEKSKIYLDNTIYDIDKEISFDSENTEPTSTTHFVDALASSIIFSITNYDKKHDDVVDEIEGKFSFQLTNPLSYIGVIGYEGEPKIDKVDLTLYIVSFAEEEELTKLCEKAMKNSIILNSIKDSIEVNTRIKLVY
ncbi:OsmC family protein [Companilactobacillus zhongbaensis]|uniref:OsmC family protein n=1 Tax=Companilactobacillus zhongbaensis TaxID=2486009 RepID=UPI000F77ACC8|nr:OsmC family protein [Companilactobacillus zhongbaensis]